MSTLQEILQDKGSRVLSIPPSATLSEVVQKLVKNNCGSLVVCEQEDPCRMVGIITERDILRACDNRDTPLTQLRVFEVMSHEPITCSPGESIQEAMGQMTHHRIRHLPVVNESGQLVGIVSIGDLVKHQFNQLAMENHYLKSYING